MDFFTDVIFYNTGYFFLKAFTFGKYPDKYDSINGSTFIEVTGGFVVLSIVSILYTLIF